ncbi:unnamed protein product, partial [Brassica rapa]
LCKDRAKFRRDLEVCLGENGRVCKVRARPYGLVQTCTDRDNTRVHNSTI